MSQSPFLPIVTPDAPRKTTIEKYGSLFYAAVAGLLVCFGLVGVFAIGVWSMRGVWADIYIVNDPKRPEVDRINAAARLARDPRVTDRQKWDLALSVTPPPIARYLLAESLSLDATTANPRGYARAVARSDGLPPFLLALLARPLAYAAASGSPLDGNALREVEAHLDPAVALWATYAIAVDGAKQESREASRNLERVANAEGPFRNFAQILQQSSHARPPLRQELLDSATSWLRTHQPSAVETWAGWSEVRGEITRRPDGGDRPRTDQP